MEHSKGNPAHTWDQHKEQSTGWLGMNYCKEEPLKEIPGGLVLLRDSYGLELDLMEKTFALAHFKSKCSRVSGGSHQGKKQATSQCFRPRRAAFK